MKVYISGKITGLDYEEAVKLFSQAEDYLLSIGMEPVNPLKNGLPISASWVNHMVRDIEMLMGCEAIYLLTNWFESRGARIERNIAVEMGMDVMFEDKAINIKVERIKYAIEMATGYWFADYTTKSRKRELYYARMAFICRAINHCRVGEISKMTNRDHSTVIHCITNYASEKRYNKDFREIIEKVDIILGQPVSE